MASAPSFESTPRIGVGYVSAANLAWDGSGTIVSILTGVAAGTKIDEIVIQAAHSGNTAAPNPADSTIHLYLYDGATNWFFDDIDIGDAAVASATVTAYRTTKTYDNLVLPSASWILKAGVSAAATVGGFNVFAFAGDLT